ncbi:hypothetical protein Tco_0332067 [Tanacetum coccineum]
MDELVFHELVWEFFASFKFSSVACRYDPNFEGILFSLGGEPRKMSLLDFGWRVGLYSEEQSRLSSTMNGLRRGETIKDEHVREDDEVEEAANEEAAGSAEEEQANWMYNHIVCHFLYLSTHDNLDPHLQIDPFLGHEADYPLYGYTGRMPPGYDYRFGPAPLGGSEYQLLRNSYGDFGPELSFDKSASLERLFSLARVSLAEASKPVLSFGCSEGDYTSSCTLNIMWLVFCPHIFFPTKNTLFLEQSFLFSAAAYFAPDFSLSYVPFSFLLTFSIMAKKDMDLYHSRLTQDDLNDLIIKYKIPRDLHPRPPSEEFAMSELPDDAIGIYHRMFDFSGARIPFSSFLLALIKHYRVHFSQLGPLGLNKRAILNAMVWRHPDVAIDDPRPDAGSFNMANVRHLSAHVVKLRDMPEGVLVLSGLTLMLGVSICDSVLRGADGNVMGIHDFLCLPEWTGAEIVARLKLLPEGIRLYFGAALSHVAKLTRSALAQSSGSTNRPSLFVGDSDDESDGDDDACVEIPLVTPLRSATVIHPSGNQGRSSTAPAAEGSNARDSRGKGIMFNDAAAPSGGVSQSRLSIGLAPSFRDVFDGAIHMDFFPFSTCPYYATYLEDCVAGNYEFTREEWDAPY